MVKKKVKKKTSKKRTTKSKKTPEIENLLVENFVSLQKIMTNLSTKFDKLATQISKLLELFEISAKSLAEKDIDTQQRSKDEKEMMQKIDNLLEQNKIIARGLTLLHEGEEMPSMPPRAPQAPRVPGPQQPIKNLNPQSGRYQKSIGS